MKFFGLNIESVKAKNENDIILFLSGAFWALFIVVCIYFLIALTK